MGSGDLLVGEQTEEKEDETKKQLRKKAKAEKLALVRQLKKRGRTVGQYDLAMVASKAEPEKSMKQLLEEMKKKREELERRE